MQARAAAVIVTFAALLAPAAAQPAIQPASPTGNRAVDPALLQQLDHPDLAQREAATSALAAGASRETMTAIEDAIARPGLTPEQRLRLREAARRIFNARERGGLGVSFSRVRLNSGVEISDTIQGFPARELLRPGDIVTAIDGVRVADSSHMRYMILAKEPGEILEMVVLRTGPDGNAGRLVVPVPLGRYSDLNNAARVDAESLRAAHELRLARRGIAVEPGQTIGSGLDPIAWLRTEGIWTDNPADPTPADANLDHQVGIDFSRVVTTGGRPAAVNPRNAFRAADVNYREGLINSARTRTFTGDVVFSTVLDIRAGALRLLEIDRRIRAGVGRNNRPASVEGLRNERKHIAQRQAGSLAALSGRAPTLDATPDETAPDQDP